jgi:glycosyltransferase involved in cell wall biosynthesis
LAARSVVLPVPLKPGAGHRPGRKLNGERPVLLWNHRWEHDKGPDALLAGLRHFAAQGADFELLLCGQRFRETPAALSVLCDEFAARISHDGYITDPAQYQNLMARADFVLSTARQEFQGLAVMEAVQQGCIPVLPDRLCYPEFFPSRYLYPATADDSECQGAQLADRLAMLIGAGRQAAPDLVHLEWAKMNDTYRHTIEAAAAARRQK